MGDDDNKIELLELKNYGLLTENIRLKNYRDKLVKHISYIETILKKRGIDYEPL